MGSAEIARWLDEHTPSQAPFWSLPWPKDPIHPAYFIVATAIFVVAIFGMAVLHSRTKVRPGVYFGLLAIEALLVTLSTPPGAWEKALVLSFGIVFCVGEIIVVQRLGSAADRQTGEILKKTAEIQSQTSEIQKTVLDMGNVLTARLQVRQGTPKDKALALSYDILRFVAERQQEDPSMKSLPATTVTFFTDFQQSMREQNENMRRTTERNNAISDFITQTKLAYETAFSIRIESVLSVMESKGVDTTALREYQYPYYLTSMRTFAEMLAEVAEALQV